MKVCIYILTFTVNKALRLDMMRFISPHTGEIYMQQKLKVDNGMKKSAMELKKT